MLRSYRQPSHLPLLLIAARLWRQNRRVATKDRITSAFVSGEPVKEKQTRHSLFPMRGRDNKNSRSAGDIQANMAPTTTLALA